MRIRVPDQWWGDYQALIGAARIGERLLLALGNEIGWDAPSPMVPFLEVVLPSRHEDPSTRQAADQSPCAKKIEEHRANRLTVAMLPQSAGEICFVQRRLDDLSFAYFADHGYAASTVAAIGCHDGPAPHYYSSERRARWDTNPIMEV